MIRNLKALGLALIAVFAMGAVVVSSASAQGKLTSTGPFTLKGAQTGAAGANRLEAFGSTVECTTVTYVGHKAFSTTNPKELIPNNATAATVSPTYKGCTANTSLGIKPATVEMTSCDFTLTLTGFTTPPGGYGVPAHLECKNVGEEAHVEIYNDAAHTERICTITFAPQTPNHEDVHLLNTPSGHLGLVGTYTGIVAKREGVCLLDGKGTNTATAKLALDVTIEGFNSVGEKTAVSVSG